MAILRVRDNNGNITDIPAIKGDKGEPGPQGPQGIQGLQGEKGDSSVWKKITDITTTEEVNGIVVTAEEFPDIAKCREFIARAVFPKSPTGSNISLGSCRVDFDNKSTIGYYFSNVTINASTDVEARCHITIADRLVFTIGTQSAQGPSAVITNANTMIGNRFLSGDIEDIMFYVNSNDTSLVFPIGTQFVIYGKVKN